MSGIEPTGLLADFEEDRIDPARFPHRQHVRVSYELLERHAFPEALLHLARGLRRLAAKAGRPEVYHETITAAFLALSRNDACAGAMQIGKISRRAIRICFAKSCSRKSTSQPCCNRL